MGVTYPQVHRIDRRHAVTLTHDPSPRVAAQRIGQQVADVGGDHVQRAAGVSFWYRLEGFGRQGRAIASDATCVGHVRDQPQPGTGKPICRNQPLQPERSFLWRAQGFKQDADTLLGQRVVRDDAVAGCPAREQRIGRA